MERIRSLSSLAMIIMLPMMIYYPYEALSWNLQLSFLDWGRWARDNSWVHPFAEIPLSTRILFFTIWAIPVLLGVIGYLAGFAALILLRRGVVFDQQIAWRITLMGSMIFSSSALALLAGAVSPMTRWRPLAACANPNAVFDEAEVSTSVVAGLALLTVAPHSRPDSHASN